MNIYYKINEDIINNYNNKNRNYEILYNINKIKENNIIKQLENIVNESGIKSKFNDIFDIYCNMNINEINIIYKIISNEKIRLFSKEFVERNKDICKIIIRGREERLKEYYIPPIFGKKNIDKLQIKLKGIMNITNLRYMFFECQSLLSLPDILKWNINYVTDISHMFTQCPLSNFDFSKWNTDNGTILNENSKLMKENDDYSKKILEDNKKMENLKKEAETNKLKINNQSNVNQAEELQLNSKMNKEEIEKLKKEIRNEYEQKIKEKFQKEIINQIKKKEEEMLKKIEDQTQEIKEEYNSKCDKKEKELKIKIDEISQLIINKTQLENNNMILKGCCKTIHDGIMCNKCLKIPIIGYRYKCSVCVDYDLCEKCEEENSETGSHPHEFIKIRSNKNIKKQIWNNHLVKINNEEKKGIFNINFFNYNHLNQYSFECLNKNNLSNYLYEGTKECIMQLVLRNNGNNTWPKNNTKLICDESSDFRTDEVILKPQNPNEQYTYEIIFKGLSGYPTGEYKSKLIFSVNGQLYFQNELIILFVIKKKIENKEINAEVIKYKNKIDDFRDMYNLGKKDYSDKALLKVLKLNNFDSVAAFASLFQ